MSPYQALSFESLLSRLEPSVDTLVLFHRNPDADAVGSAYALKRILEDLGSRAWCVCERELPERLRFLLCGEQNGVSPCTIPADFSVGRIVSVDTASPSQLGELWELYGDRIDLMIDHHGMGEVYADHYIRPDAAATAEILFDVVKTLASDGRIRITASLCTALYAAISADTGGFRFSNVTPDTHLRASELMSSGIDCAHINHLLFDSYSMEQLRARSAGISNLHLFANGAICVVLFPYALKVALGLEDEHLETLVDIARSLAGVKVAISIRQPSTEGVFRVSMRSSSAYDVSALCALFGGGGHKKAAGCTVFASDAEAAMHKILASINSKELD